MNRAHIESAVRDIHKKIWRERKNLWLQGDLEPIDLLKPEFAARVLGITYQSVGGLGTYSTGGQKLEIAGVLDREAGNILISERFPLEIIRFTGAHEIGHWIMHPHEVMHRDRPMDGSKVARSKMEKEADYFAACFLMPPNLLRETFIKTFGLTPPIKIDENLAFWLCPDEPDELVRPAVGSNIRERILASATSFNGRHFEPLAKQFRVSLMAMAIRLKELNIIAE